MELIECNLNWTKTNVPAVFSLLCIPKCQLIEGNPITDVVRAISGLGSGELYEASKCFAGASEHRMCISQFWTFSLPNGVSFASQPLFLVPVCLRWTSGNLASQNFCLCYHAWSGVSICWCFHARTIRLTVLPCTHKKFDCAALLKLAHHLGLR